VAAWATLEIAVSGVIGVCAVFRAEPVEASRSAGLTAAPLVEVAAAAPLATVGT
jgi:hypothetical protein